MEVNLPDEFATRINRYVDPASGVTHAAGASSGNPARRVDRFQDRTRQAMRREGLPMDIASAVNPAMASNAPYVAGTK